MHDEERRGSAKVTVVGTGQVGMAAAFAMMTQVDEIYTLHVFTQCCSIAKSVLCFRWHVFVCVGVFVSTITSE